MGFECIMCFDKLLARENNTFSTNCGHIYHRACIEDWIRKDMTCPRCRKPNPAIFQIFLDLNETDVDTHEPQHKLQNENLMKTISDLKNQMEDNTKRFEELYLMIEQITISMSSFEVQNQELRREKDSLQQLLEAKTLQDSQKQLSFALNEMGAKENIPRHNSKMPPEDNIINREQKTSRSLTIRFDDLNQLVVE